MCERGGRGQEGVRKERLGNEGSLAQGQPGVEGEGHVGSQGRRDVLAQGPAHAAL